MPQVDVVALGRADIQLARAAIFWFFSPIISFHWLIQPTVREIAKIGVNIPVGKPIASRMMPE